MPNTKSAGRLMRGDQILLGNSVYTVGNMECYWTGDVRVNLTDVFGWQSNRLIKGEITIWKEAK
jgi:hypothetical protein